jgi:hypothetical protein
MITVYVVINSQDGEVLGVYLSEDSAIGAIIQYAVDNKLDFSTRTFERSEYDPTYSYVTIGGCEHTIVERQLIN